MYADTPPELCKEIFELAHELKNVGRILHLCLVFRVPAQFCGSKAVGGGEHSDPLRCTRGAEECIPSFARCALLLGHPNMSKIYLALYVLYGIALYAIISLLVSHISISYILVLISLCMLYMRILLTVWSRINPYELYIMNASRCMFYIQLVIFY